MDNVDSKLKVFRELSISIAGLCISFASILVSYKYNEHQINISKPVIDVTCDYSTDYRQIKNLNVISSGSNVYAINETIYPYIDVEIYSTHDIDRLINEDGLERGVDYDDYYHIIPGTGIGQNGTQNRPELELTRIYYDELTEHYAIPIDKRTLVFKEKYDNAKNGRVVSIFFDDESEIVKCLSKADLDYKITTISNKAGYQLNYFLEVEYEDLDHKLYTDVYHCKTGIQFQNDQLPGFKYISEKRDTDLFNTFQDIKSLIDISSDEIYDVGVTAPLTNLPLYSRKTLYLTREDTEETITQKLGSIFFLYKQSGK